MASAHIELVGNETRLAGQFRSLIDRLQTLVDDGRSLKLVADQAAAGNDWPGMRAAFGLGTDADAEAAYNLLVAVSTALSGSQAITNLLSRMG